MKKHIFAIIFAVGFSVFVNAGPTYAQSGAIRIDIPFAFTANDKALPAGPYIVKPASDSRIVWELRSAHDKPGVFLLAGSLSSPKRDVDVRMTFRRYGERNFLISFRSTSYEVTLTRSASERDFQQTWHDVAKNDPVIVEAVSTKK